MTLTRSSKRSIRSDPIRSDPIRSDPFRSLSLFLSFSLSPFLSFSLSVCVQHSDGQCEHTLRLPDSFLACCALSDLRSSFVTMSLAQVRTTVIISPIMVAELA